MLNVGLSEVLWAQVSAMPARHRLKPATEAFKAPEPRLGFLLDGFPWLSLSQSFVGPLGSDLSGWLLLTWLGLSLEAA